MIDPWWLPTCQAFSGISLGEAESLLSCLGATEHHETPGSIIYPAGSETFAFGIVLAGSIDIVQEDYWGRQSILSRLGAGDLFAESFVFGHAKTLPVSIVASEATHFIRLSYARMMCTCAKACAFHQRFLSNLLSIVARKNVALTEKMTMVTQKTIRDRVLAYLSQQAKKAQCSNFVIPYDRQALADYLAVDRSALSRELSAMQQEGLIAFSRSYFQLLAEPTEIQ